MRKIPRDWTRYLYVQTVERGRQNDTWIVSARKDRDFSVWIMAGVAAQPLVDCSERAVGDLAAPTIVQPVAQGANGVCLGDGASHLPSQGLAETLFGPNFAVIGEPRARGQVKRRFEIGRQPAH